MKHDKCPKCESDDINNYVDIFMCFNCKYKEANEMDKIDKQILGKKYILNFQEEQKKKNKKFYKQYGKK